MKKTTFKDFWMNYNFSNYSPRPDFGLNRSSRLKKRNKSAWEARGKKS